jgi:hypothetical protein
MAGNMAAFINSMLEMRKQNAAAAAFRAEQEQQQAAQIQKAIAGVSQNIGSSIARYGEQQKQDQLANLLGQQYFGGGGGTVIPQATAVDPAMQAQAARLYSGMRPAYATPTGDISLTPPQTFTGGMDELKMRMALEELGIKRTGAESRIENVADRINLATANYELSKQKGGREEDYLELARQKAQLEAMQVARQADAEQRLKEAQWAKEAEQAYTQTEDKYKEVAKATNSYNKNLRILTEGIRRAAAGEDRDTYEAGVDQLMAHWAGATESGAKHIPQPKFASWDEVQAIKAQQKIVDEARTAIKSPGVLYRLQTNPEQRAAAFEKQQQALQALPGYSIYPANVKTEEFTQPLPETPDFTNFMKTYTEQHPRPTPLPGATGLTGGGGGMISLQEARSKYPNARPGQVITLRDGTQLVVTE